MSWLILPTQLYFRKSILTGDTPIRELPISPKLNVSMTVPSFGAVVSR